MLGLVPTWARDGEGKRGREADGQKEGENGNSVLIIGWCSHRRPVCVCSNSLLLNTFKRKMERRLLYSQCK